jgi:glycosyltransferase involved in cell wall biosynthesis
MSLITVGLPVYNADAFIRDAIQSILNQTFKDFHLLIIDDGSTDNSIATIKTFNDPRIELVIEDQNLGLPYRLNQIAKMSNSKYLARMDADDIMHPEKLEKQLKVLESNPEIDVLGTNAYSIDKNNLIQGIRFKYSEEEILKKVKEFIHPTIVAKTEWFKNNPYDVKATRIEDAELWDRTLDKYNFSIITQPLLFYREFGTNYYKRYQNGISAMFYVSKKKFKSKNFKSSFHWTCKGLKFLFKFIIYRLFSFLNIETFIIENRSLKLDPLKKIASNNELYKSIKMNERVAF